MDMQRFVSGKNARTLDHNHTEFSTSQENNEKESFNKNITCSNLKTNENPKDSTCETSSLLSRDYPINNNSIQNRFLKMIPFLSWNSLFPLTKINPWDFYNKLINNDNKNEEDENYHSISEINKYDGINDSCENESFYSASSRNFEEILSGCDDEMELKGSRDMVSRQFSEKMSEDYELSDLMEQMSVDKASDLNLDDLNITITENEKNDYKSKY